MNSCDHAGLLLREFREEKGILLTQLSIKTELVDADGFGISVHVLSRIENKKRELSPKYLDLLEDTGVFAPNQMQRLRCQAIIDMVRRKFGVSLPCMRQPCTCML